MNEALTLLVNHLADFRRAGVTSLEITGDGVKVSFRGDMLPGVLPVDDVDAGSRLHRDHPPSKPEPPQPTSDEMALRHIA